MKKRLSHPILAGTLLAIFVLVSVGLTAQAAAHTLHHAHHKASAHATLLCSWVCSAGQVIQAFDLEMNGPFLTMALVDSRLPLSVDSLLVGSPSSRAPPAFSLQ